MAIQNIYLTEGTSLNIDKYLGTEIGGWTHRTGQPGSVERVDGDSFFNAAMIDGGPNTHIYMFSVASGEIACRFVITENTMQAPVAGNARENKLNGTDGADVLAGRDGDDRLTGDAGDDILDGGTGNDKIDGGAGNDTLTGFLGKDTFAFKAGSGEDTITDFDLGVDVITFAGVRQTAQQMVFNSTETADGVLIDFGNGDTVLLEDIHFIDSV